MGQLSEEVMRKYEVKSLLGKRLIPLLLVPTLLGSNFVSIKAFADGENLTENVSEVVETPVVEETPASDQSVVETPVEEVVEETVEPEEEEVPQVETEETKPAEESEVITEEKTEEEKDKGSLEKEETEESEDEEEEDSEKEDETSKEDLINQKKTISFDQLSFPVELEVELVENEETESEETSEEPVVQVFAATDNGTEELVVGETVDVKVEADEEVFTEEGSTPMAFEYSYDEEELELVGVTFNGEECSFADNYITFDVSNSLFVFEAEEGEDGEEAEGEIDNNILKLLIAEKKTVDITAPVIEEGKIVECLQNVTDPDETGVYVVKEASIAVTVTDDMSEGEDISVFVNVDGQDRKATYDDGKYVLNITQPGTYKVNKITAKDKANNEAFIPGEGSTEEVTIRVNEAPKNVSVEYAGGDWINGTYSGNELTVTIKADDDMGFDNLSASMKVNGEPASFEKSEGNFVWKTSGVGNYTLNEITITDKDGGEKTVNDIQLYVFSEEVDAKNFTVTITGTNKGENWYSFDKETKREDPLDVYVEIKADRFVTSVSLNGQDAEKVWFSGYDFKTGVVTYSATVTLNRVETGKYDKFPVVVNCWRNKSVSLDATAAKPILIDNDKPEATAVSVYYKNKDCKWVEVNKNTSEQFFSDEAIEVEIRVPKSADKKADSENYSGMDSKIDTTVRVLKLDKDKDEVFEENRPLNVCWNLKEESSYYSFKGTLPALCDDTVAYVLDEIKVFDKAGNSEVNEEYTLADFIIDKSGPSIKVEMSSDATSKKATFDGVERVFYDGNISATITVSDYDISQNGVEIHMIKDDEDTILTAIKEGETVKNVGEVKAYSAGFDPKHSEHYKRTNKLEFKYTLDADAEYYFYVKAIDKAKNESEYTSDRVVRDTEPPVPVITYSIGDASGADSTYTNQNVTIKATVTDRWFDADSTTFDIFVVDENGREFTEGPDKEEGKIAWTAGETKYSYVATYTTKVDGAYSAKVVAKDIIGHESSAEKPGFTVDTKNPVVTLTFDNNDARNGKYYNKERTATIKVEDYTFDADNTKLNIEEVRGTASQGGWDNPSKNVYTKSITFGKDGKYSLSFSCIDKAKNASNEVSEAEFIIDCTEPKISVSFAGGTPKNEIYYKDARTATISIDEMSFDANSVEYTAQAVDEAAPLPAMGTFTSAEDINTAQITFSADGKYGFVLNCTDLAGNTCTSYISDVFIIDTTAPEVTFSGVENFSANNGTVAPVVSYTDKYMDMNATTVQMVGANNGVVSLDSTATKTENGFVVSYSDFAHDKKYDDLYTLQATVVDLAGNEVKGELIFSVNRYGSVFALGDATKALNEKYYTNEAQDIVITEINVDELTYRDVSISRDGDIKDLKKDKNYSVAKQGNDVSWKTYTYTISKDNFEKDGVYSVTVYTKDRATNTQDNKSRDAEVNFAVDKTKPSIVTAGISEGDRINAESHNFNIDVTDNMGLSKLVVYSDDEVVKEFSAEELGDVTATKTVTLQNKAKIVTITIEAEDVAGNVETLVYSDVVVSTDPEVLEEVKVTEDPETPLSPEVPKPEEKNSGNIWIWTIVALGAVALVSGSGVVLYKKKK